MEIILNKNKIFSTFIVGKYFFDFYNISFYGDPKIKYMYICCEYNSKYIHIYFYNDSLELPKSLNNDYDIKITVANNNPLNIETYGNNSL